MADQTLIAWCDATANFWIGCLKVSPGCKHCYAETFTKNRMGFRVWGPASRTARKPVKGVYANVRKLEREAAAGRVGVLGPGAPLLVFVGSLMDWAEDHPDAEAVRPAMWELIRESPHLHFQMLTKRPERIADLLPRDWGPDGWPNVWLGTSVESAELAWRAETLGEIPAAVRFVSYEPALGPLAGHLPLERLDWIIYGGESGPGYRPEGTPEDPKAWARDMMHACHDAGVAFFHKQSAAPRTEMGIELDGRIVRQFPTPRRVVAPSPAVATPNAMACGICGGPGDLLEAGIYECRKNPARVADRFVGIWTDLNYPETAGAEVAHG